MVSKVSSLRCDGCGAPLPASRGTTLTCSYCFRELLVVSTGTQVTEHRDARSLTDRLLRGYTGEDAGSARRFSVDEMRARDWPCLERGLWPVTSRASTSWGGGWDAAVLVGAPRVYPSHGDRRGAWAPKTRDSAVEWIEVEFARDAPAAAAIRVFETNDPGASFAVTALEGGNEELLWQRAPSLIAGSAQVLEIELAPPRRIGKLRVYVSNAHGPSWAEIDTVGLVAAEPLPEAMRAKPRPAARRSRGCLLAFAGLAALSACAVTFAIFGPDSSARAPMPVAPAERVLGGEAATWEAARLSGVVWATEVAAFSSEYSEDRNGARASTGAPDVYPGYGDRPAAWAPSGRNAGEEFLELRFAAPVRSSAVVIVETFGPGAVRRVDDLTPGRPAAILWEGQSEQAWGARVLAIELREPREISAVRVVLDTARVQGWNEIDAVGLAPAR